MAISGTLRRIIVNLNDDGSVHLEATVALADEALGVLDNARVVSVDDPAQRAAMRQAAVALAAEIEIGVPLTVPQAPA